MMRLRQRARAAEALLLLLGCTALRRWVPMRLWAPWLVGPPAVAAPEIPPDATLTMVDHRVGQAVRAACRRSPVAFTCLDQCVAGALMLRRRGAQPELVIGLSARDPREESHAWLLGACGGVVIGDETRSRYVPASVFRRH